MYLRAVHAETDVQVLQQLIHDHPLGVLTTAIKSDQYPTIQSSHIPFILDPSSTDATDPGILRGHLARQNPQSKAIIEALKNSTHADHGNYLEEEVMVLFTSPIQHYVTPKFYTSTKPVTGKVVPTWNYAAVQAYGRAKIFYDSSSKETGAFLSQQINDLSRHAEGAIMGFTGEDGRQSAWKVADAPESYIRLLQKNIIGIEIRIERLGGKFKMSQESTEGDREGVAEGFEALDGEVAAGMARTVRERKVTKLAV